MPGMSEYPTGAYRPPGLRDHYPPNRWREVAPRGQSIPQFVEVARELCLEIRDRLSIYSSRSLVGLHLFESFPDFWQHKDYTLSLRVPLQ